MRLAAPVSAAFEVEELLAAGSTEFYCGIQDHAWQAAFGNHDSISRRQGAANLADWDELRELVRECGHLGATVMLTLNGSYSKAQLPMVLEAAEYWEQMGGHGLMVCDLSLLILLQERGSGLVRGLSLLAAVSNPAALAFYRRLGVSRVVLPRFLSPAQMGEVLAENPGVEGEAIVMLDKCPFIDGLCRFVHGVGYAPAPPDLATQGVVRAYDIFYRLPACWELFGRPVSAPACAACSVGALADAGIGIFKIGGRGRSLETRIKAVSFFREAARMSAGDQRRALFRERFGCECGDCYYER